MRRVENQRRQSGGNFRVEVPRRLLLLRVGQLVPFSKVDSTAGQLRDDGSTEALGLPLQTQDEPPPDLLEQLNSLRGGRRSKDRDPLHHELVQVRGEDCEKLYLLE